MQSLCLLPLRIYTTQEHLMAWIGGLLSQLIYAQDICCCTQQQSIVSLSNGLGYTVLHPSWNHGNRPTFSLPLLVFMAVNGLCGGTYREFPALQTHQKGLNGGRVWRPWRLCSKHVMEASFPPLIRGWVTDVVFLWVPITIKLWIKWPINNALWLDCSPVNLDTLAVVQVT